MGLTAFLVYAWVSAYWWIAMAWASGSGDVTAAQVWAGQGVIVLTLLIQIFAKWRSDRLQYQREERQRAWDLEDRRLAREQSVQRADEIKYEVQETHRKLDDGIKTKLDTVFKRFDTLPEEVAQKPTVLAPEAVEQVAETVATKVINGSHKPPS